MCIRDSKYGHLVNDDETDRRQGYPRNNYSGLNSLRARLKNRHGDGISPLDSASIISVSYTHLIRQFTNASVARFPLAVSRLENNGEESKRVSAFMNFEEMCIRDRPDILRYDLCIRL